MLTDPETKFFDLRDDNLDPSCDDNLWRNHTYTSNNTHKTSNQLCVTQ